MRWFATDELATIVADSWDVAQKIADDWRYGKVVKELKPGRFAHQELEKFRSALQEIAEPLSAMQRRAEANGDRLSGMAYSIANDPNYIKEIARKALKE